MNEKTSNEEREPTVCQVYDKTGACLKGELCNKSHRDAPISRAIVLHHIYPDPDLFIEMLPPGTLSMSRTKRQRLINAFFLDVAEMLMNFGQLDDMVLCGNKADHISGSVIALFHDSNAALAAKTFLNGKYYAGRKIEVGFAPIPRLSLSICKNIEDQSCQLGDMCNFVHPMEPDSDIYNMCFPKAFKMYPTEFRKKRHFMDSPNDTLYMKSKQPTY